MNAPSSRRIGVVTTPFILSEFHYLFMTQTIISLLSMRHDFKLDLISVINSFNQSAGPYEWLEQAFDCIEVNDRNNLSRAWNKGVRKGFERGCEYVLVINLDLSFHSEFLSNLVSFADAHPDGLMWSGCEWPVLETIEQATLEGDIIPAAHFSCFLIDRKLFKDVGEFDEQFEPAYHEDSDMLYRIKLQQGKVYSTPRARFFHLERVTLKGAIASADNKFLDDLRVQMDLSMERYKTKWGGLPGQERFMMPYNEGT